MKRRITRIDPHPTNTPDGDNGRQPKRRVAAYARVSTSSEEQLASFEAQKDYYVQYIASNPNWEFAGLYTDEDVPYPEHFSSGIYTNDGAPEML